MRATTISRAVALLAVALTLTLTGCGGPAGADSPTTDSSGATGSTDIERELGDLESTVREIEKELADDGA